MEASRNAIRQAKEDGRCGESAMVGVVWTITLRLVCLFGVRDCCGLLSDGSLADG